MNEFAAALGLLLVKEEVEKYFGASRKIERWVDNCFIVQDETGGCVAVYMNPSELAICGLDGLRQRMKHAAHTLDKCVAEDLASGLLTRPVQAIGVTAA